MGVQYATSGYALTNALLGLDQDRRSSQIVPGRRRHTAVAVSAKSDAKAVARSYGLRISAEPKGDDEPFYWAISDARRRVALYWPRSRQVVYEDGGARDDDIETIRDAVCCVAATLSLTHDDKDDE